MPSYRLIMSNDTFKKLLERGAKEGKSMGRLINDILNEYANDGAELKQSTCCVCEEPAVYSGYDIKQHHVYVCEKHKSVAVKGWASLDKNL